jgi:hypothetical protein
MTTSRHAAGGDRNRRTPVGLWVLAGLLLFAGPARAETPDARLRPLPTPQLRVELATELSDQAHPIASAHRQSQRVSPAMAFNQELREEAIDYRYTSRWAHADEELAGDRSVRRGRARAAEAMLGDAAGAALEVIARDAFNKPRGERSSASTAGLRHQLRVDSKPSWRLRATAGLTRMRIDLPLSAHDELAFSCTRRIDRDRCERELGASVRLNPWDESIRFGFELDF